MPADTEKHLLANLLLAQQGGEAWAYATAKMRAAKAAGDVERTKKWFGVLAALKDITLQAAP